MIINNFYIFPYPSIFIFGYFKKIMELCHLVNGRFIVKPDVSEEVTTQRVLTDEEVLEIKRVYNESKKKQKLETGNQEPSISYRKLAKKYGVHFTTIQRVIQGSYW